MKFTYKIEATDFLEFQLFTASRDSIIQKRKIKSWILFSVGSALFGIFSFINGTVYLAIYFGILAIVIAFFYPNYFRWRYKKQYANFIARNYSKRFGEPAELEITKEFIHSKDKVAEGKVKLKEIEAIHETIEHFFIKMSSGMSFIIPKRELSGIDLKSELTKIGLNVKDELHWSW